MRTDVLLYLIRHEMYIRMRKRMFWIAVATPVGFGVVITAIFFWIASSRSREVILIHDGSHSDLVNFLTNDNLKKLVSVDGPALSIKEKIVRGGIDDATLQDLSAEIIRNKLCSFVVISGPDASAIRMTLYGDASNDIMRSMVIRLKSSLLLYKISPGSKERARALSELDRVSRSMEIRAPITGPDGVAKSPIARMLVVPLLILLGILAEIAGGIAISPLFSSAAGKGNNRQRTEIELSVLGRGEIITSKIVATAGIGMILLAIYSLFLILPAVIFEIFPRSFALWYFVFWFAALMVHAPICITLGLANSDSGQGNLLLSMYQSLGSMSFLILGISTQIPDSIMTKACGYCPLLSQLTVLSRLALVPDVPWWEPILSLFIMGFSAFVLTWIAIRTFSALVMTSTENVGIQEMIRLIISPRGGCAPPVAERLTISG